MINTDATLTVKNNNHKFIFKVFKNYASKSYQYNVFITQITDMSELGLDPFEVTYKCVSMNSKTEHDAIHYAGAKYIKNWNKKGRIGKDGMILN